MQHVSFPPFPLYTSSTNDTYSVSDRRATLPTPSRHYRTNHPGAAEEVKKGDVVDVDQKRPASVSAPFPMAPCLCTIVSTSALLDRDRGWPSPYEPPHWTVAAMSQD
jgi:hypothetical protein